MPPNQRIDLSAYDIRVRVGDDLSTVVATVLDLPGCTAVAASAGALRSEVEQAILRYLDDHPDAPRHVLD